MNDAQYEAVQTYLNDLRDILGLRDWVIELDRTEPHHDGAWAEVTCSEAHDTAWVRVAYPHFFDQRPEDQRDWLIHELVHCHFNREGLIWKRVRKVSGEDDKVLEYAEKEWDTVMEFTTERLARVFASLDLPLPEFPPSGSFPETTAEKERRR